MFFEELLLSVLEPVLSEPLDTSRCELEILALDVVLVGFETLWERELCGFEALVLEVPTAREILDEFDLKLIAGLFCVWAEYAREFWRADKLG